MINPADAVCILEASIVISKFAESKHRLLKSAKQRETSWISSIGVWTTIFDIDFANSLPLSSKINISKRYVASDVPNGTFTVALTALASSTSKSNVAGSNFLIKKLI